MYEIWISRNNVNFDKLKLTYDKIITKILTQLQNIIQTHYKVHKVNGIFTNGIATINNNKLERLPTLYTGSIVP